MRGVLLNSWLFPTLICAGLSVIYLFEWRASRADQRAALETYSATLTELRSKRSLESMETRSLLEAVREAVRDLVGRQDALVALVERGAARDPLIEEPAASGTEAGGAERASDPLWLSDEELALLPLVPEGMNPMPLVESMELEEFYGDPRFNSEGIELDPLEYQRAGNVVAHARARLATLRSDLFLLLAEEKPKLFAEGMYIDYAKGERREPMRGVYTTGEILPGGGMRIYPFFRDRYPELYAMQEEMARVSDVAVRVLMDMART